MRNFILIAFFLGVSFNSIAQSINSNPIYIVKNNKIYSEEKDVTESLSEQERQVILDEHKAKLRAQQELDAQESVAQEKIEKEEKAQKDAEKREKELRNSKKEQKKAKKKQKRAEKALKKKVKAQKSFDKVTKKLKSAQKKYNRLKKKEKLSPSDKTKWLKKIEGLNHAIKKAEKKLRRA